MIHDVIFELYTLTEYLLVGAQKESMHRNDMNQTNGDQDFNSVEH